MDSKVSPDVSPLSLQMPWFYQSKLSFGCSVLICTEPSPVDMCTQPSPWLSVRLDRGTIVVLVGSFLYSFCHTSSPNPGGPNNSPWNSSFLSIICLRMNIASIVLFHFRIQTVLLPRTAPPTLSSYI